MVGTLLSAEPVLDRKVLDAAELPLVVGYERAS
jgi:hypothetical protein